MTEKGFGMTTIVDEHNKLLGIYTDGDLRRSIDQGVNISRATMGELMNRNPRTLRDSTLAAEALNIMEASKITALIVEDEQKRPIGVLHMHDILRAGVV
jgi:arabinose-5-phosphate isomerase